MKQMIGKLLAWFLPADTTEHKYALLEMRVMGLEMENKELIKNFDAKVSISVSRWLSDWISVYKWSDDENFSESVQSIIDDHDYSDVVEDNISNRDWSDEISNAVDYDDLADKVLRKIDWSDVISDNDIVTSDDIDCSDVMLKSEQLSEDETIKRGDLSDEISNDLKRDWFPTMVAEIVDSEFQRSLGKARVNASENCQNAIDDEIQSAVAQRIEAQMKQKFGDSWDNWFNENIRHTVQTVLGEMLESAYEQTKKNTETDNNA